LNRTYKEVVAEKLFSFSEVLFKRNFVPAYILPDQCPEQSSSKGRVIEAGKVHTPESGQKLAGYVGKPGK
jgi:hypothetical protein